MLLLYYSIISSFLACRLSKAIPCFWCNVDLLNRYTDSPDGDWVIGRYPGDSELFLATSGSGHAFKVRLVTSFQNFYFPSPSHHAGMTGCLCIFHSVKQRPDHTVKNEN